MAWCTVKSYALFLFKFIVLCLHHFFFIASQEQTGTVATGSDNIGGKLSCFYIDCIAVLWPVLHLSFNLLINILAR